MSPEPALHDPVLCVSRVPQGTSLTEFLRAVPTLETPRLVLRKLTMADAPDVFAYASHPAMDRHTAWPPHRSIADAEAFLTGVLAGYENPTEVLWGLVDKASGRVIGTLGFYGLEPGHAVGAIGYVLSPEFRGQGLMPEAARAALDWAFCDLGLNRVQAICRVDNMASSAVLKKLGFEAEGLMRARMLVKGRFIDMTMYGLLAERHGGVPAACGEMA